MEKKVYLIENSIQAGMALQLITERIPCFINPTDKIDDCGYMEVEIKCYADDIALVERFIADFV